MKESKIEKELKREVERIGGACLKWISPGNRGIPDRIILYRGRMIPVELKRPRGTLGPLQEFQRKRFAKLGVKVEVVDDMEGVHKLVKRIQSA